MGLFWAILVGSFGLGATVGLGAGLVVVTFFAVAGAIVGFADGALEGWQAPDKLLPRLRRSRLG